MIPKQRKQVTGAEWKERVGTREKSTRERIPRKLLSVGKDPDHPTDQQARTSKESLKWMEARKAERNQLQQYGVYSIVEKLPSGVTPVDTKWVYVVKRDAKGNVIQYKARKVGRGFTQEYGINYDETYSQMARPETWRILLTLMVQRKWKIQQWDVVAAYLQADLRHEVYVEDTTEEGEKEYWKLHKALYGLKQAGYEWYMKLRGILEDIGFHACIGDPGCYVNTKTKTIVCTHVDDLVAFGPDGDALDTTAFQIEKEVELKKSGRPSKLLGMELTWDLENGTVKLTQQGLIANTMKAHQLAWDTVPIYSLPVDPLMYEGEVHQKGEGNSEKARYGQILGSLLFIARQTRPEVSVHMSLLGRRVTHPSEYNIKAAVRILQYLSSTNKEGIHFSHASFAGLPDQVELKIYVDASYGGEESRSQTGVLVTLNDQPINWYSRRQDLVTQSATEAEYVACAEGAKDASWGRQFLEELLGVKLQPVVYTDNNAAEKLCKT